MDINRANLDALMRTYMTAFQAGLDFAPPVNIGFLVSDFPSSTASNFYAWLDLVPGFREWVGERLYKNVRSQKFEVLNRDWEDTVTIPAKDVEDDQYGVYTPIVRMMGAAWALKLYQLPIAVLTSNAVGFDGAALCADTHTYGDYTFDNLTTSALSVTTFNAAFLAGAGWQFSNGEYIQPRFTHLLHGPKLRSTAFALVDAEYMIGETNVGGTKNNEKFKRCERVEIPDFVGTYDDYWFLIDGSRPVHAISRQIRKTPSPRMSTDPEWVQRYGKIDYLADGRAAAAPAFPHMVYGGIL